MSDPLLSEWRALRRVHEGGIAKRAGVYLEHGCPVPSQLTDVFDRLVWTGLVAVAAGDPIWALRQLSLTAAGQTRYATLCAALRGQRERVDLPVPPAEFGTPFTPAFTTAPTGRRPSAAPFALPAGPPDPAEIARAEWA